MANPTECNSWLCIYAIAQLGRPYWYNTQGQIASLNLYNTLVLPHASYNDYKNQIGQKVHDCEGLVAGALTCMTVNDPPTLTVPIALDATAIYNGNCKNKSDNMTDFPDIPGTLVFRTSGKTKLHMGIYVGDFIDADGNKHTRSVVEATGHALGVVTSPVSNPKWDSWGQLEICTIDTTSATTYDARIMPTAAVQSSVNPESIIQTKDMKPFVATIAQGSNPTLDYKAIKAARVSAMMFFGGESYDAIHIKKKTYINPYLDNQVQQCNSAGLPYAIYVNVRATDEIEADAECRALYYVISRYPPSLGLWLSLNLTKSVSTNDKILNVYYKYIERWGLADKCGLYVTKKQLSTITWGNFMGNFYLWMIEPMEVDKIDEELLKPEMFEVED